jgi:hypothetical protein
LQKKKNEYVCANPECRKPFDKPKLVQYYACPFCSKEIKEENLEPGCLHHFGYLSEREKNVPIPPECIECMKSVECMLANTSSKDAAQEIQKWYK